MDKAEWLVIAGALSSPVITIILYYFTTRQTDRKDYLKELQDKLDELNAEVERLRRDNDWFTRKLRERDNAKG